MSRVNNPNNKVKMKNHLSFNSTRDLRIECFTNLDTKHYRQDIIALRTGKFKISRNDTERGKRYFINDYRECVTDTNAVVVFCDKLLSLLESHDVLPIYSRDDLNVFTIGEYNHPQIKKLTVTADSVYEEFVKI